MEGAKGTELGRGNDKILQGQGQMEGRAERNPFLPRYRGATVRVGSARKVKCPGQCHAVRRVSYPLSPQRGEGGVKRESMAAHGRIGSVGEQERAGLTEVAALILVIFGVYTYKSQDQVLHT